MKKFFLQKSLKQNLFTHYIKLATLCIKKLSEFCNQKVNSGQKLLHNSES